MVDSSDLAAQYHLDAIHFDAGTRRDCVVPEVDLSRTGYLDWTSGVGTHTPMDSNSPRRQRISVRFAEVWRQQHTEAVAGPFHCGFSSVCPVLLCGDDDLQDCPGIMVTTSVRGSRCLSVDVDRAGRRAGPQQNCQRGTASMAVTFLYAVFGRARGHSHILSDPNFNGGHRHVDCHDGWAGSGRCRAIFCTYLPHWIA